MARLHDTSKKGSASEKSIEEKHAALCKRSEELKKEITDFEYERIHGNDTKYLGGPEVKSLRGGSRVPGIEGKRAIKEQYDTYPVKPREAGLYKKLQDNK